MSFIYTITPTQSKAARIYLGWTQQALADAANLGRSTVCSFEDGGSVRRDAVVKIRKALEKDGIEFTENDGVKRRCNQVNVYRGYDSCDNFYNDVLDTVQKCGDDIHCIAKSQGLFLRALGIADPDDAGQLEVLSKITNIKCLITEPSDSLLDIPSVQFRSTANCMISPALFFGYGNKYVHALEEGQTDFSFIIFHMTQPAHSYRVEFLTMWENATLLLMTTNASNRHSKVLAAI